MDLRTNAAFLLGAFLVLTQDMSPEEAGVRLAAMGKDAFAPFRDATYVWPSSFHLTLVDCWSGLKRAVAEKWFSLTSFDVHKYLVMGYSATFDLHQICPKLVARTTSAVAGEPAVVPADPAAQPACVGGTQDCGVSRIPAWRWWHRHQTEGLVEVVAWDCEVWTLEGRPQ